MSQSFKRHDNELSLASLQLSSPDFNTIEHIRDASSDPTPEKKPNTGTLNLRELRDIEKHSKNFPNPYHAELCTRVAIRPFYQGGGHSQRCLKSLSVRIHCFFIYFHLVLFVQVLKKE